jgi:hypothetical protein
MKWKIEVTNSSLDTPKYRQKVESYLGPIMNWLCDRIAENDLTDFESVDNLFKQIIEELPVMRLMRRSDFNQYYDGPDFYIQYNKHTNIYFEDNSECMRREIIINKLLK